MFSQLRYVQDKLDKLPQGQLREIAEKAGVPFGTVKRIARKSTLNPRVQAIDKLAMHFRTKEKRSSVKDRCRFEDTCVHSPNRK